MLIKRDLKGFFSSHKSLKGSTWLLGNLSRVKMYYSRLSLSSSMPWFWEVNTASVNLKNWAPRSVTCVGWVLKLLSQRGWPTTGGVKLLHHRSLENLFVFLRARLFQCWQVISWNLLIWSDERSKARIELFVTFSLRILWRRYFPRRSNTTRNCCLTQLAIFCDQFYL